MIMMMMLMMMMMMMIMMMMMMMMMMKFDFLKMGQGQLRVIIYINFVELEYIMPHAKFHDHNTISSVGEEFLRFLP